MIIIHARIMRIVHPVIMIMLPGTSGAPVKTMVEFVQDLPDVLGFDRWIDRQLDGLHSKKRVLPASTASDYSTTLSKAAYLEGLCRGGRPVKNSAEGCIP